MIVDAVIDSLIEDPVEEIEQVQGQAEVIEIDTPRRAGDTRDDARREQQGD